MIPHVAKRGHSFKGAGVYYLHDKGAATTERVAWTYTHNLPTNDPEKGMNWMAYTAMNADNLKVDAGVSASGRKAETGAVYSFSLAWHPEQKEALNKQTMLDVALDALGHLGLKHHQAVIVAHQETEHPHIHVVTNLVNPENGKTCAPRCDHTRLSEWAEEYEKENGKIYCDQRVQNNNRRRELKEEYNELSKEDRPSAFVKHRDKTHERQQMVEQLYGQSDSGKAFMAALNETNLTLAKGDRRGYVLVDIEGNIYSLSRQLKDQRAKDIKARFSDLDHDTLPVAKDLFLERQQQVEPNLSDQEIERPEDSKASSPALKQDFEKAQGSPEPKSILQDFNEVQPKNQEEKIAMFNAKSAKANEGSYDRDQDEIDQQNRMLYSADIHATESSAEGQGHIKEEEDAGNKKKEKEVNKAVEREKEEKESDPNNTDDIMERFEREQEWRNRVYREWRSFETLMKTSYDIEGEKKEIERLEKAIEKNDTVFGRMNGKHQKYQEELESRQKVVENINQRISEQRSREDHRITEKYPHPEIVAQREKERITLIEKMRIRENRGLDRSQDRDKGRDMDLDR